jgi:hypothetical protein
MAETRTFHIPTDNRLPAGYNESIGLLINQWAHLEFEIRDVIMKLMAVEVHLGLTALGAMQARTLVSTFRALALISFPNERL